jgi:hypothetical protein
MCVRGFQRRTHPKEQFHSEVLVAPARMSRPRRSSVPRSPAYSRFPSALGWRTPKGCSGTPRPQLCGSNARCVQPCSGQPSTGCCGPDRRSSGLSRPSSAEPPSPICTRYRGGPRQVHEPRGRVAGASVHESRLPEQLAWQGYFRTTTAQLIGLPAPCTGGSKVYSEPAKNRIGSGFNTAGWSTAPGCPRRVRR